LIETNDNKGREETIINEKNRNNLVRVNEVNEVNYNGKPDLISNPTILFLLSHE